MKELSESSWVNSIHKHIDNDIITAQNNMQQDISY